MIFKYNRLRRNSYMMPDCSILARRGLLKVNIALAHKLTLWSGKSWNGPVGSTLLNEP